MKLIKATKSLIYALYNSIKRFPITIGLTTAIAIILIIIKQISSNLTRDELDNLSRLTMVLALGIPLSLCIKLVLENYIHRAKLVFEITAYIIGAFILILYYLFLIPDFKMVSVTRYIAISIALYFGFFFVPYLSKKQNFEYYVIKVLSGFFITLLYLGVLFGGLSAIMFTLDKLLSVPIKDDYYYYVWLITAGVFAPSYFLGGLPTNQHQFLSSNYSKALKILLLYIVMPIITAYTTILYVYFAKIIITLQWPVGLVTHLVLWFSVVSTGVIFLISPLYEENKWVKTFVFWFTKLIIPIIIMMFVSITIRINAYGITENRYYVIVLGLWVLGIMIYLNFTKTKKNITLPISLAIIAMLSVTGPWSSYSISKFSQNNRFEAILVKNDMLKDNTIIKKETGVSDKDKTELSQILTYFERNHKLSDVKYLPENFSIDSMGNVLGFSYYYNDYYGNEMRKYFNYGKSDWSTPIDISGFDYLIDNRSLYSETQPTIGNMQLKYNIDNMKFEVILGNETIYSKTLSDFGHQLFDKYGMVEKLQLRPEDMQFIEETDKLKLKFIILNVYGEKDVSLDKVKVHSAEFYVLVKVR